MLQQLKYSDVHVHPVKGGWITVKRIQYKELIINSGFFTNAANIPRIGWRLIPPNDPEIFPAVVVHDFLCEKEQFVKADNYLEDILVTSKVKKWKRVIVMSGVRTNTKIGRPIKDWFKGFFV